MKGATNVFRFAKRNRRATSQGRLPLHRRALLGLLLLVGMLTTSAVLTTTTASADVRYPINFGDVCQNQGHTGASLDWWSPYGWYCYDLSLHDLGVHPGLDIQAWCSKNYPGSAAKITETDEGPYGWRCSSQKFLEGE